MRARTARKRQVDFFVEVEEALRLDFRAKDGREAQQKIGAFAGSAGKRAIQMAQNDFSEVVLGGGGPQQIGIQHRGVADSGDGVAGAAAAFFAAMASWSASRDSRAASK